MLVLAILIAAPASAISETLTAIPGDDFSMGDAAGDANEKPHQATVAPFRISPHEVTNKEFADFVRATSHVTNPQRSGEGYVWTDRWRSFAKAD